MKSLFFSFVLIGLQLTAAAEKQPSASKLTTFMKDGGWCWYQDPRAIINNGKLVIGGVSGQSGDVKVSAYDLKNNKDLGTVVLHENFQRDDHDVPAFYVRPDGRLLAVYAKHNNEKVHYYHLSASDNYLEWGPVRKHVHNYAKGSGVTYMNLYPMQEEKKLYNFYRDGETFNPAFITSTDEGETWGERTHFISDEIGGRHRPYARYLQRGPNTIGISFTEGHPRNYGNSLYYADFRAGVFYKADGTKIKRLADGPLTPTEAEKIYPGSETLNKPKGFESVPNSAWTCVTAVDQQGHPHLGYTLYLSNDDHRYRLASWDGQAWIDREIAFGGKCLYTRESSYTGLLTLGPLDPTQVAISADVDPSTGEDRGGTHEIYTAFVKTEDNRSSIHWTTITSASQERNLRPIIVAGEGYKVLIWLRGPWYSYTDYHSDVVGLILETPQ
ncbi:BNR-4 repeat-containing protein [Planctomycetota bacterium]